MKNEKYERGEWLDVKIHILFYLSNSWNLELIVRRTSFGTVKDNGHTYKFYLHNFLFYEASKYGVGANFGAKLEQMLNGSVYNSVIVCNVFLF